MDELKTLRENVINTANASIFQATYITAMMIFVGNGKTNTAGLMSLGMMILYTICTSYLFKKSGESDMKKNYVSYGIIAMINLSVSVLMGIFFILGNSMVSVIIGLIVGLIWTIIFLIAYAVQRKEYKILKEKLDEELKEGLK